MSAEVEMASLGECVAWGHAALAAPGAGRLAVFAIEGNGDVVLGRFGAGDGALMTRASGGPVLCLSGKVLYVGLALDRARPLIPDVTIVNFLNRYVRPLRHALSGAGRPVAYFGRDWLSVEKRPVAQVGFAYDDRHALFEAWVSIEGSLWEDASRSSFRGRLPTSLAVRDWRVVVEDVAGAYRKTLGLERARKPLAIGVVPTAERLGRPTKFDAEASCAIGSMGICMHGGRVSLGGDWMANGDEVARIESSIEEGIKRGDVLDHGSVLTALSSETLGLFGVETLASYATLIVMKVDSQRN